MGHSRHVAAERVVSEIRRRQVIDILGATYQREKRWVDDPESQFPAEDLHRSDISWFVAGARGGAAGVVRVLYDPPLAEYSGYGLKVLDKSIDVEAFLARNRIAEIGRFAVMPRHRRSLMVAVALMGTATEEAVARGYTHFITDVFEDDPHSPYGFHTRVMGFRPVATHDFGELNSTSRRITLVLDLKASYNRLRLSGNWFFRYLTGSWDAALHQRLAA